MKRINYCNIVFLEYLFTNLYSVGSMFFAGVTKLKDNIRKLLEGISNNLSIHYYKSNVGKSFIIDKKLGA